MNIVKSTRHEGYDVYSDCGIFMFSTDTYSEAEDEKCKIIVETQSPNIVNGHFNLVKDVTEWRK